MVQYCYEWFHVVYTDTDIDWHPLRAYLIITSAFSLVVGNTTQYWHLLFKKIEKPVIINQNSDGMASNNNVHTKLHENWCINWKGKHTNMCEYYHLFIQTKSSDVYLYETAPDQLVHSHIILHFWQNTVIVVNTTFFVLKN